MYRPPGQRADAFGADMIDINPKSNPGGRKAITKPAGTIAATTGLHTSNGGAPCSCGTNSVNNGNVTKGSFTGVVGLE